MKNIMFFCLCIIILSVIIQYYYMNVINQIQDDITYIKTELDKKT